MHFEITGHLSIGFSIVHSLGQGHVFHCFCEYSTNDDVQEIQVDNNLFFQGTKGCSF